MASLQVAFAQAREFSRLLGMHPSVVDGAGTRVVEGDREGYYWLTVPGQETQTLSPDEYQQWSATQTGQNWSC